MDDVRQVNPLHGYTSAIQGHDAASSLCSPYMYKSTANLSVLPNLTIIFVAALDGSERQRGHNM